MAYINITFFWGVDSSAGLGLRPYYADFLIIEILASPKTILQTIPRSYQEYLTVIKMLSRIKQIIYKKGGTGALCKGLIT